MVCGHDSEMGFMYTFFLRNVMEMFEDFPGTQMTLVLILNDLVIFQGPTQEKRTNWVMAFWPSLYTFACFLWHTVNV